jgi:hypothetical protein
MAQRECSAWKHYDPQLRLAASVHVACQSCGSRGLLSREVCHRRFVALRTLDLKEHESKIRAVLG